MTHTPGPWTAKAYATGVVSATKHVVATIPQGYSARIPPEERVGNARLIAAAPEMLEALKQVTNAFARYISGSEGHYYEITQARAAIAKAEGA